MEENASKLALIIGAGPAGLTAGYELRKLGWDGRIVIVESNQQVGGISRTVQKDGNRFDLGGHRLFSKSQDVCALWDELMPLQGAPSLDDKILNRSLGWAAGGPDPEQSENVRLLRHRLSRIYFRKHLFYYPIGRKLDFLKALRFDEYFSILFSYLKVAIMPRKERSLEDFFVNHFGYKLYSLFFEDYTEKVWGIHPSKLEPDFGAQRVRGVSIWGIARDILRKTFKASNNKNVEASLIDQYTYPKRGIGQMWEIMASKLLEGGAEILTGTTLKSLTVRQGKVEKAVVVGAKGAQELHPDVVLSSMAVNDLFAAIDDDNRPQAVFDLAAKLRHRSFLQVSVLANGMTLKNVNVAPGLNGIVPDSWMYIQDRGVRIGRMTIFNNWSPYMVDDPQKHVFMGTEYFCDEGDAFWNKSDTELSNISVSELEKLGIIRKDQVIKTYVERVPKAYPCYDTTYRQMDRLVKYLDAVPNLYCIGRNGQHRYNNMDHSMMTGLLAARHIQGKISDKGAVWKVNADAEYHEEKK